MTLNIQKLWMQYKSIVKNALFLSIVDGIKLLMPFIAMPYIIHTCGTENYGKIIFAQSLITYFSVAVNFGLNIFIVKEIAGNTDSQEKLSRITSSFLFLRLILIAVNFVVLCLLIMYVPFLYDFKMLLLYSFIAVLAEGLTMTAVFQGMEKMHNIAILQSMSVLFYISALLITVREQNDYELVPLLQSVGLLLSSLFGIIWLQIKYKIKIISTPARELWSMFKSSTPFALSRIAASINVYIPKLFAGFTLGMHDLALLDIALKISDVALVPASIVDQAVYPHNARHRNKKFASQTFWAMLVFGLLCGGIMIAGTPIAIHFFGAGKLNDAVTITYWLSLRVIISVMVFYTGTPLLVAFGYSKIFNSSTIFSSLVILFLYSAFYFADLFLLNTVIALLIFNCFIDLVYRMFFCLKYKIISLFPSIKLP